MIRSLLIIIPLCASFGSLFAAEGEALLGNAIRLDPATIDALTTDVAPPRREPRGVQSTSGFSINRQDRTSVAAAYHRYYADSETYTTNHAWNGNVAACTPGTVSAAFLDDTLRRINYFRAQAGLPSDIYFTATKNTKAQQAALMMSRNNALSHSPPTTWPCYTAGGAEAAAAGNLSLGTGQFGPGSVNGQLIDDGSNNAIAGHRRWLLYSRAREMGAGAIPTNTQSYNPASCIWVIGDFKPAPAAQAVPWPNEGYVPWKIVPNQSQSYPRWSFSYPGASFASATVTVTRGGTNIPVTKETVAEGYADNTIVWRPTGIPDSAPASDTTYTVTISGVGNAPQSTFTYNVTLIDPFTLGTEINVSGPAAPIVGQSNAYTFNQISGADQYQASISGVSAGSWLEGAESAAATTDGTSSSYNYRTTALAATGSYSFHLTIPNLNERQQTIGVSREIVPTSSSRLEFKNRFRFMTAQTQLHAEVSQDGGANWDSIWSRSPSSSILNSNDWETAWNIASIAIPAEFHGRAIQVRMRFAPAGAGSSISPGTSDSVGAFVDDIAVTNSNELVNSTPTTLSSSASGFNFNPPSVASYALRVRAQAGTNFSATAAQNTVKFGSVTAQVTSATTTQINTVVPSGATGTVGVTVAVAGLSSNAANFQVTQPGGDAIYATDFSTFADGPNAIDGTDGWIASPQGDGSSGTFSPGGFPALGRSAFIGFNALSNDLVAIWRPLNRDPVGEGRPVVDFSVDLAIFDSANNIYDIFSVRFYNAASQLLATVTLDNRNLDIHTWDGVSFRDTGENFENGVLFSLSGSIDFATNRWSAQMVSSSPGSMHVPLFSDIPFHTGGRAKDLGLIAFAWQLNDLSGQSAGDNFMLVDNFTVGFGSASGAAPRITRTWMSSGGGTFNMTWQAVEGYTYRVRHSGDMKTWSTGLPNSVFTTAPGQTQHTFSNSAAGVGARFYQVTATPP